VFKSQNLASFHPGIWLFPLMLLMCCCWRIKGVHNLHPALAMKDKRMSRSDWIGQDVAFADAVLHVTILIYLMIFISILFSKQICTRRFVYAKFSLDLFLYPICMLKIIWKFSILTETIEKLWNLGILKINETHNNVWN
jgi:hypothetical protein